MKTSRRIAILTTSFGAGHFKAAQAVEQALQENNTAIKTKLIDSFILTAPRLTRAVIQLYLRVLTFVPSLYGKLYSWGNQTNTALLGRGLISKRLAVATGDQLADFSPQSIICTHASPAGAVCQLKKQGILRVPIIAVITDFVVHRFWIYDEVDIFTVMHEKTAQSLIAAGVAPGKIHVTGIPIAAKFANMFNKIELRKKLKLQEDIPTVLIMGGGTGTLPMDSIVAEFNQSSTTVQLLVVAGQNEVLRQRLSAMASNNPLHVFGFVDNVHELMGAADLLISKPGGLSAAEALAIGLPMLLFRPIPGQEEGNAKFLTEAGVAYCINDVKELPAVTTNLLKNPDRRNNMRRQAKNIAKPQASQTVADIALSLAESAR